MANVMNPQDAAKTNQATVFCTIEGNRYAMLNAKKVEVKANVSSKEVPRLGTVMKGRKSVSLEVEISMTVYKCSNMFDAMIKSFKETGVMPTFDVQVTSNDPTTSFGTDSKIYQNCAIDGDVLLSLADADGDFIEQEITAYASDFSTASEYTQPSYM